MGTAFANIQNAQLGVTMKGTGFLTVAGVANQPSNSMDDGFAQSLAVGTGAAQIDKIFSLIRTIVAGGTDNLDLSGALTDILGQLSQTAASISAIMIQLLSAAQDSVNGTACSSITLGAHATAPWIGGPFGATDTYKINNGGKWLHADFSAAGLAVVATTGDILKIVNNDGAVAAAYKLSVFCRN